MVKALLCCLALVLPSPVLGADATPLGYWTTIDDHTHEARSIVEITEHDGALSGRIVKLFRKADEDPDPPCVECSGERHNARVIGMQILWGLRRSGDEWNGGEILDPETGSIYRATLRPSADNRRLDVRGFIGVSLFGRTQTWERAQAPPDPR